MSTELAAADAMPDWRAGAQARFSIIALAITAIFVIAALLVLGIVREQQLQSRVVDSYASRQEIERLFSLIQDAETGQRGYIISANQTFLAPYDAALTAIPGQVVNVERAIGEDTAQHQRFERLKVELNAKLSEMAATLSLRESSFDAAAARLEAGMGRMQMDAIRASVAEMMSAEAADLAEHTRQARQVTLVRNALIGLMLLSLIGLVAVALWQESLGSKEKDRLLAQAEEGRARLLAVFDNAVDGIVTLNPSGSIETVNRAALRLFGYEAHELLRRDISRILDLAADNRTWFLRRLAAEDDLTEGFLRELPARRRDGQVFPVDVALGGMELGDGRHVVAVIRDISERRRIEEMKEEFVGTVSHELRTPLTSIAGSLGLLQGGAGGILPSRAARLVEIAEANSRRLVRLINDILDFEKVSSSKTAFSRDAVDLDTLAASAIDAMAGLAEERGVTLDLAAAGEPLTVLGDRDRLIQVLNNLLSNAVKFSPTGGRVEIAVERRLDRGLISVRDFGPGVPASFRGKLFQKFAQADASDARGHGGTGLGLAIAKEIVERMDGAIGFQPPADGGACFLVDLPLMEVPTALMEASNRFLICEGDVLNAEVIRDDFERHGLPADLVTTAAEARHALHSRPYAGLVLDMHLPDSDGLTLIRVLRDAPVTRNLPIVVVSAYTANREAATTLGIAAWLEKPADLAQLRRALLLAGPGGGEMLRILHVDDDHDVQEVARGLLGASGVVSFAATLAEARYSIRLAPPDLVILDVGLADGSGLSLIPDLRRPDGSPIPVILYTAQEPAPAALGAPIEAVLVKSRATLPQLAQAVRRVVQQRLESAA